ncbi:hypothetical protein [Bifidobacterium biavatii]|uniref:Sugar-binding protein n=1 Tax=Bifidobacterium biavatii DSM 23969 TaxID=1437608 RepID=A0A086ZSZ5_9BIFI|nr:hypothetical protein [Bifidobacterium biavatii]KFI49645.1 sugar-binding protein [Bifidobacterium biavatii DSM 23969]
MLDDEWQGPSDEDGEDPAKDVDLSFPSVDGDDGMPVAGPDLDAPLLDTSTVDLSSDIPSVEIPTVTLPPTLQEDARRKPSLPDLPPIPPLGVLADEQTTQPEATTVPDVPSATVPLPITPNSGQTNPKQANVTADAPTQAMPAVADHTTSANQTDATDINDQPTTVIPNAGLPLTPGTGTVHGGTATGPHTAGTGAFDDAATQIMQPDDADISSTVLNNTDEFAKVDGMPVVAPTESDVKPDDSLTRELPFNPKVVIAAVASVAVVAALVAGVVVWNNRRDGTSDADRLAACQAAYSDYSDAAKTLQTALADAKTAQSYKASQVADASTLTTLKQAVADAQNMDDVKQCDADLSVGVLVQRTTAARTATDTAKDAAQTITNAT